MKIGKPERRFIVRILDLRSGKSKNFSVYGEISFERIYKAIKEALERLVS